MNYSLVRSTRFSLASLARRAIMLSQEIECNTSAKCLVFFKNCHCYFYAVEAMVTYSTLYTTQS